MTTPAQTWLAQIQSALTAVENFNQADPTAAALAALTRAGEQLASLTQQLQLLSPAERESLRPQLAGLLGRLAAATSRLETSKNEAATQLQNLRSQTRALTAYTTVPAGNPKR